jgi:hypothetical protein
LVATGNLVYGLQGTVPNVVDTTEHPYGVELEWSVRIPSALHTALDAGGGQVKLCLTRTTSGVGGTGWFHSGCGDEFSGVSPFRFVLFNEGTGAGFDASQVLYTMGHPQGSYTEIYFAADTWYRIRFAFRRTGTSNEGRAWVDGVEVLHVLVPDADGDNFGWSGTTTDMHWDFGAAYCQNLGVAGPYTIHVDHAVARNATASTWT